MDRVALLVGINSYDKLPPLNTPAEDAEAIARLLTDYGDFQVHRLPEVVNKASDADRYSYRLGQKTPVTFKQLEDALVQLFKPNGKSIPDTALFYFAGHGLRKDRGIQEGFLATSDVNPNMNNWGLRLKWLRELLQESPVRQQIICLDCCYSGELLNFDEADPGDRGKGRDRCFIAASREYELAYEETSGNHGVLTGALLNGLDPTQQPDGVVTNFTLIDFINQTMRSIPQRPIYANSGGQILLTGRGTEASKTLLEGTCPYKGLSYFDYDNEDPQYFYGREALTDQLLEKVREDNFLAVLGASGSGKSSVVRAGLLYQLKLGQRLSGSDRWVIHAIRPGDHPLQSLASVFVSPSLSEIDRATQLGKAEQLIQSGAIGLTNLVKVAANGGRVVLVVDQFEEVFTLCRNEVERQQFLECLLGALENTNGKLCLVLAMRADFFSKCAEREYAGLVRYLQKHLVTVTPMTREELEQAIVEPAKKVGLELERGLVGRILEDVEGPGSLPLLQYTLTELWDCRIVNRLTLAEYTRLGGVKGTLQKRADEVYMSLETEAERLAAKRIFIELTQLGEGTEDTRRQVFKQQLITAQQPETLINRVLQTLTDCRLVVTNDLQPRGDDNHTATIIDVAHEVLIRHWLRLRQWVNDNRDVLRKQREFEEDALEWEAHDQAKDYLLRGVRLSTAEDLLQRYADQLHLSTATTEFLEASRVEHDRLLQEKEAQEQRELNLVRETLAQERRARKATQRTLLVTVISVITLGVAGGIVWEQYTRRQYSEVLALAADGIAKPELLPAANYLLQEADSLSRSANETDIARSLTDYRAVITLANLLKAQGQISPNAVSKTFQQATTGLVKTIEEHRLPELEADLKTSGIGGRVSNRRTDFERQFSDGALRKTYAILRREWGVKADLYDSGRLSTSKEADRMPCEILKEIQKKWQERTGCSWSSGCQATKGESLTQIIFNFPYDSAKERLRSCEINPGEVNPG